MAKFRKKPVVIDAIQNGGDWHNIGAWLTELAGGGFVFQPGESPPMTMNDDCTVSIQTLEGEMTARIGDWIIRGVAGEYYPCKPDIFEATYDPVE